MNSVKQSVGTPDQMDVVEKGSATISYSPMTARAAFPVEKRPPSAIPSSISPPLGMHGYNLQDFKLFIGGISWETTEASLKAHFSRYGDIVDCVLMTNKWNGAPRGFAFVTFGDGASVSRVLCETHMLDGRVVEVKRAIPKDDAKDRIAPSATRLDPRKLFVGGLASTVSESDLRDYFGSFGSILDATVMIDRTTNRSRGFGFITFSEMESVENVLRTSHRLHDKIVEVKPAQPRSDVDAKGFDPHVPAFHDPIDLFARGYPGALPGRHPRMPGGLPVPKGHTRYLPPPMPRSMIHDEYAYGSHAPAYSSAGFEGFDGVSHGSMPRPATYPLDKSGYPRAEAYPAFGAPMYPMPDHLYAMDRRPTQVASAAPLHTYSDGAYRPSPYSPGASPPTHHTSPPPYAHATPATVMPYEMPEQVGVVRRVPRDY